MRKIYRRLRGEGPLVRIGLAIGGMLALALAIAAVATIAGAQVLDIHGTRTEPLTATTLYDLLKIAFAVAAGIGGVIALVTAYRRQRITELAQDLAARAEARAARDSQQQRELASRAEKREVARLFNERFATAAGQLGDDKPAVQLAGVYAMAGLADDWPGQRQTCVNLLCAYLRMPYQPDPGDEADVEARQAFQALREVRHTVIRVIAAHLQSDDERAADAQDWRGLNLDFTGTVFDGGDFYRAQFTGGMADFNHAQFTGGMIVFNHARLSGGAVRFAGARFSGGQVLFEDAEFSGSLVSFVHAEFSGGEVSFAGAEFSGGAVVFDHARFSGGEVDFAYARFSGGVVGFSRSQFASGKVNFDEARFSGSEVRFDYGQFKGATVDFSTSQFTGGRVDFRGPESWEHPPLLPDHATPGVLLRAGSRDANPAN